MPRVQCLDCRKILSGYEVRSYVVEYAYCERCFKTRSQKFEALLQNYRTAEQKAKEEKQEHHEIARQAAFLSSWDPLMPLADVSLQAPDGPHVPAHKAVLAGKSPVFKAMFGSPMKEAQTGVVVMDDIPHQALEALVSFFYTATVKPHIMKQHAAALFCAADKYGIPLLKGLCEEHMAASISNQNALSNMDLARKYSSHKLKTAVLDALLLDMEHMPTCADYKTYAQRDPSLLVELYEGIVEKLAKKRKRSNELDDEEMDSWIPSKSTPFSLDDAESITG